MLRTLIGTVALLAKGFAVWVWVTLKWALSKDGAPTVIAVVALFLAFSSLVERDCIVLRSPGPGYATRDVIHIDGVLLRQPRSLWAQLSSPGFNARIPVRFPMVWDVSGAPEGDLTVIVEARRSILFFSALVQRAEVVVRVDRTPPEIRVVGLPDSRVVRGDCDLQVPIDEEAVVGVVLDGVTMVPVRPGEAAEITLRSSDLADGSHELRVSAIDEAGNASSRTVAFLVDNLPFDAACPGLEGRAASGSLDIVLETTGGEIRAARATLVRMDSAHVAVGVAGGASGHAEPRGQLYVEASSEAFEIDTTSVEDGEYALELDVESLSGERVALSYPLTIDNTPPALVPVFSVDEVYTEGTLYIGFDSSERVEIEIRVNGAVHQQGPIHLDDYDEGDEIAVWCKATDTAGNTRECTYRMRVSRSLGARLGQLKHQLDIALRALHTASQAPFLLAGVDQERTSLGFRLNIPRLATLHTPMAVPLVALAFQRRGLDAFWIGTPRLRRTDDAGETHRDGAAYYGTEIRMAQIFEPSEGVSVDVDFGFGTSKTTRAHLLGVETADGQTIETWHEELFRGKWASLGISSHAMVLWFPGLLEYWPSSDGRLEFSVGIRLWSTRRVSYERAATSGPVGRGWRYESRSSVLEDDYGLALGLYLEFTFLGDLW